MHLRGSRLVFGGIVAVALTASAGLGVYARSGVGAYTPRVVIVDNDGTFAPGDAGTGMWGYAPSHITVTKGEQIVFDNPVGNFRPHSVTSLVRSGTGAAIQWESGTVFDSSPTRDQLITVGTSFTLDTSNIAPGHYLYYCNIHPWMAGSVTVTPAP